MRFSYSTIGQSQGEIDSLPRAPLVLHYGSQSLDVIGLVDSAATVNVLPYDVGLHLGAVWEDAKAVLRLGGNLGHQPAMPLFVKTELADFAAVRLAFAWTKTRNVPLILGQTNFFMEFDVCFYRSQLEFEVKPK